MTEDNKMKTDFTELVFILDKSGSMSGLESDTIGGYNAMLAKQKEAQGEASVTTVLFDDGYQILHDRIHIKGVAAISEKDYYIGGSTALLDAIGKTINKIGNVQKHTSEEERAGKVMFVITTDGMENASQRFTYDQIRQMIEHQKEKYGWEFIFLGANIDAISTAAKIGISEDRAANYKADSKGTEQNFAAVYCVVNNFRDGKAFDKNWKKDVENDHKKRNGRTGK
jgi:uncharacterized protein YegL